MLGLPEDVPQFESFLQSLGPSTPQDPHNWTQWTVIPEEKVVHDDVRGRLPGITLWYQPAGELSHNTVIREIAKQLRYLGHPDGIELSGIVLAFFAHAMRTNQTAVSQFNEVFTKLVSADLNQYFLFSAPSPPRYRFQIGSFSIGPFVPDRLAYQSRKADSDFYDRYESMLRQSPLAIERKPFPVKVIAWHKLVHPNRSWNLDPNLPSDRVARLWDAYFSTLSAICFEQFFEDLNGVQEIYMALGSGWINALRLGQITGNHRISVYLNIGGENVGFVSPASVLTIGIDLGGAHLGIPATEKILKEHFNFEGLGSHEVHQTIRSYCHFLALGVKHHHAGHLAEGFLHSVIAMDLLLGERVASTKSVAKRSAVLCHRPLNKSFPQTVSVCEKIYDLRSRYVHAGQVPEQEIRDLAMRVSREIALCLFRLQRDVKSHQPGFRDKWVKDIDFVAAALESGRLPSEDDYGHLGVVVEGDFHLEDLDALLRGGPFT